MRLEKTVVRGGDTTTFPTVGDSVKVHYALWLLDDSRPDKKGRQYSFPFLVTYDLGTDRIGWIVLGIEAHLSPQSVSLRVNIRFMRTCRLTLTLRHGQGRQRYRESMILSSPIPNTHAPPLLTTWQQQDGTSLFRRCHWES